MLQAGHKRTTSDPSAGLLWQFLTWVGSRPRSYSETMEAWRTSCPRISVWEDALADGLVQVDSNRAATQAEVEVSLTPAGRAFLASADPVTAAQRPD